MRVSTLLLWLLGVLAIAALITSHNAAAVIEPVLALRTTLIAVVVFHLLPLALDSAGWRVLFERRPSWRKILLLRWASEGVNGLLPVPHLGELLRVFALGDEASPREAGAVVMVDITIAVAAQAMFAALGIAFYLESADPGAPVQWLVGATIGLAVFGLGLFLLQLYGMFGLGGAIASRAAGQLGLDLGTASLRGVDATIRQIYGRRRDIFVAFLWRLGAWIAGSGEIWLAAKGLDLPLGPSDALILESLAQAARTIGFIMPAGLGVQEGILVLLAAHFGITPEAGLGIALVRRARELILGAPAMGVGWWLQWHARQRLPPAVATLAPAVAPAPIDAENAERTRL